MRGHAAGTLSSGEESAAERGRKQGGQPPTPFILTWRSCALAPSPPLSLSLSLSLSLHPLRLKMLFSRRAAAWAVAATLVRQRAKGRQPRRVRRNTKAARSRPAPARLPPSIPCHTPLREFQLHYRLVSAGVRGLGRVPLRRACPPSEGMRSTTVARAIRRVSISLTPAQLFALLAHHPASASGDLLLSMDKVS